MRISLKCPTKAPVTAPDNANEQLKELLYDMISEQGLQDSVVPVWKDNGSLEADHIPSLLLHAYLLKAERMGLSYSMERKVVIHFETGT